MATTYINGRPVKEGTSGADEQFLSDEAYAAVQQYKQDWETAKNNNDQAGMDAAHAAAEALRAATGMRYSGGEDGGRFITLSSLEPSSSRGRSSAGTGSSSDTSSSTGADTAALQSALSQWKAEATAQANSKIDYAVQQAVDQLERALEDAQPQFQEQAESVARDERQGLDNSALYAELRGDKGGIGQSQYNEIQAAAAQNRLAVQQAQTKLSTDTARQIEDLRAQGEFEKADAALQISQSYLSQLIGLEQWAAEYSLSTAQFEASLQQWQSDYELSMAKLQSGIAQNSASLNYQYTALTQNQSASTTKQLASMGLALLQAGIMPNSSQLSAMGMTEEQARQYIMTAQLKNG